MVKGKVASSKSNKKAPSNTARPSSASPAVAAGKQKLCGGGNAPTSIPTCCGCGEHVTDDIKALQCDKCQRKESWKCADCLNLSNNVYDALVAENGPPLRWFCEECDEAWKKPGFGSSDCQAMLEQLLDKMATLETTCGTEVNDVGRRMAAVETKFEVLMNRMEGHIDDVMTKIDRLSQRTLDTVDRVQTVGEAGAKVDLRVSNLSTKLDAFERNLFGHLMAIEQKFDKTVTEFENTLEKTEPIAASAEALRQDLVNRVDDINSKLDSPLSSVVQGCIEGALKTQLTEDKVEEQEIQRRKTSVIAHGVSESDSESTEERIDHDLCQVAAMLHELDSDGVKVEEVIRLGKRHPESDESSKPRPLKIVLDTEKNKIQVIRRAKNLRDKKDGGWEKVFVHQDLTPRQREGRRKLVQTLKTRLSQGEKDLVIYRGEIVKRRRS